MLAPGLIVLLLGVMVQACAPASTGLPGSERGAIAHRKLTHGEYMEYRPRSEPRGVLVIAHGSTEAEKSEQDLRKSSIATSGRG